MSKGFGFTLAEVLITLGIIGVVASMTIPTLMQNIQDNEFKNKLKKEYSVISEAYQLLKTDSGGTFEDALAAQGCSGGGTWDAHLCFKNVFKQRLSFIKECTSNGNPFATDLNVCFPAQANVKFINGNPASSSYLNANISSGLVLKDGASFALVLTSATCQGTSDDGYPQSCGYLLIDVNGVKPPNVWGRDVYLFTVNSNALRPFKSTGNCASDGYGFGCASQYLLGN